MTNEECYCAAKNRYYNACSEIGSCRNVIESKKSERQRVISEKNRKEAELKKYEKALEAIEKTTGEDEKIQNNITDLENKLRQYRTKHA